MDAEGRARWQDRGGDRFHRFLHRSLAGYCLLGGYQAGDYLGGVDVAEGFSRILRRCTCFAPTYHVRAALTGVRPQHEWKSQSCKLARNETLQSPPQFGESAWKREPLEAALVDQPLAASAWNERFLASVLVSGIALWLLALGIFLLPRWRNRAVRALYRLAGTISTQTGILCLRHISRMLHRLAAWLPFFGANEGRPSGGNVLDFDDVARASVVRNTTALPWRKPFGLRRRRQRLNTKHRPKEAHTPELEDTSDDELYRLHDRASKQHLRFRRRRR